jgi:(2R)-sulfolactate sulfo-lyase subunit alpha
VPIPQLLVHHKADNVGVIVVEGVSARQELFGVCLEDDSDFWIAANQDTPIGHKVALADLAEGQNVIKYGQVIGRLIAPVKIGDHVHTHNLKTLRW